MAHAMERRMIQRYGPYGGGELSLSHAHAGWKEGWSSDGRRSRSQVSGGDVLSPIHAGHQAVRMRASCRHARVSRHMYVASGTGCNSHEPCLSEAKYTEIPAMRPRVSFHTSPTLHATRGRVRLALRSRGGMVASQWARCPRSALSPLVPRAPKRRRSHILTAPAPRR